MYVICDTYIYRERERERERETETETEKLGSPKFDVSVGEVQSRSCLELQADIVAGTGFCSHNAQPVSANACQYPLPSDWEYAKYMTSLDHELKMIVVVPFHFSSFVRLGILLARARQLGW